MRPAGRLNQQVGSESAAYWNILLIQKLRAASSSNSLLKIRISATIGLMSAPDQDLPLVEQGGEPVILTDRRCLAFERGAMKTTLVAGPP
jgi:hypothetical protein